MNKYRFIFLLINIIISPSIFIGIGTILLTKYNKNKLKDLNEEDKKFYKRNLSYGNFLFYSGIAFFIISFIAYFIIDFNNINENIFTFITLIPDLTIISFIIFKVIIFNFNKQR